ncbi:MAG: MurR/RpiR family transcriptional regulator, partial [bacterium]
MSILSQLEKPLFKVTKSDKIILKYLKNNLNEFSFKSITEISQEIEVGEATITRFTRKMGFNSLQDFRVNLTKEVTMNMNMKMNMNNNIIYDNIVITESMEDSVLKLLNNNVHMLEN